MTSGPSSDDPEASGRILFAAALAAGALLRLVLLGQPDLFGADEGRWAIGAQNLVVGGTGQLLGLSETPLGPPGGTPILFPWVLSVMLRVFGPEEWTVRLPSAILGLLGALLLERVIRRGWGQPAGHLAGAFAALFPPLVAASRAATVEPTLVMLGLAGIIFGLRAFEEDIPWEGAIAGAFFGLGFLAKGYAVGLYLIPLLLALGARPRLFGLGRTKRALAFLAAAFVLVGFSHLLAVFLFRRASFAFELATAFGASEAASRAAALPTAFGVDVLTLVRSLFFFLPLAVLGVVFLGRPVGESEIASGATGGDRRLAHGVLWGAYVVELLILVAVAGRYRLSSIPVMPALAAFTGLGGTWLLLAVKKRTSPLAGAPHEGRPRRPPRMGRDRGRAPDPSRSPHAQDGRAPARGSDRSRSGAPAARGSFVSGDRARRAGVSPLQDGPLLGRRDFGLGDRGRGARRTRALLGLPDERERSSSRRQGVAQGAHARDHGRRERPRRPRHRPRGLRPIIPSR